MENAIGFPVYDYRTDVRNVLVTPQIRSRFLRMEPGQSAQLHSHDLGHEIFLILEGRVEFEIDGETEDVGTRTDVCRFSRSTAQGACSRR